MSNSIPFSKQVYIRQSTCKWNYWKINTKLSITFVFCVYFFWSMLNAIKSDKCMTCMIPKKVCSVNIAGKQLYLECKRWKDNYFECLLFRVFVAVLCMWHMKWSRQRLLWKFYWFFLSLRIDVFREVVNKKKKGQIGRCLIGKTHIKLVHCNIY